MTPRLIDADGAAARSSEAHFNRVLVTGGSGFIGSHLLSALAARKFVSLNLDLVPSAGAYRSVEGDVTDERGLGDVVKRFRPNWIINLAAVADISLGPSQLQANIVGIENIARAASALDERPLVTHISTQLVVGPGYQASADNDYSPYTAYGESKAASEDVLRSIGDLDWTILRPTNVWGPRHPSFATQIWRYLDKGWYLHPAGMDPIRSYGYVENVVNQIIGLGLAPRSRVNHRTFYVTDRPISSATWVDTFSVALRGRPARRLPVTMLRLAARGGDFADALGLPSPINSGRLYRMTEDYPVPVNSTFEVISETPKVSLIEGVSRTVSWLRSTAWSG